MSTEGEEARTKPEVQFAQIPLDVLHAVCIELGGTRGACLASVLAARYGVAKAPESTVNRKAVAAATEARPGAVRMALNRLRSANILVPSEGGFRFNPRASQCTSIGPDKARNIRRLALPKASRHGDATPEKRHAHVTPPSRHGDEASRPRDETSRHGDAPIKREREETPEYLSQSASEAGTNSRFFPDNPPEAPLQPTGPKYHPGATPEVRAELIAMADTVNAWGPECSRELGMGTDPEHVREALRRAARTQPVPRTWRWVGAVLDGIKAHGLPRAGFGGGGSGGRRLMTDAEIEAKSARIMANLAAYEEKRRAERGAVA